jgi:hypothetical protein
MGRWSSVRYGRPYVGFERLGQQLLAYTFDMIHWKKQGPNVCSIIKLRDRTNTLFMAVCLICDETNQAPQGWNVRDVKKRERTVWWCIVWGRNVRRRIILVPYYPPPLTGPLTAENGVTRNYGLPFRPVTWQKNFSDIFRILVTRRF